MLSLKRCQGLSCWNFFVISFTIFITFTTANPQSSGRQGNGRGFGGSGRDNGNSDNKEVVFTVDMQPEITAPVTRLYEYDDSFVMYYPLTGIRSIRNMNILRGPPDIGCVLVNIQDGGARFASKAIYTPETKSRYPRASSTMSEPVGALEYMVFFRLPPHLDPNHIIAVLTSEDGADPSLGDPGFHIYFLNFDSPGARGKYTADRFDEPVTIRKAALVHAPNPNSRVQVINQDKSSIAEITLGYQMLEPFNRAMFMIGGEEPPPGPMLSLEQLNDL